MKLYKGDANRGTFRTTQSIFVIPQTQRDNNFVPETGATRNYGRGSGVNGANLSSFPLTGDIYRGAYGGTDEDGVADDCRLWNQRGQADKNGMQGHSVSYLTANSDNGVVSTVCRKPSMSRKATVRRGIFCRAIILVFHVTQDINVFYSTH